MKTIGVLSDTHIYGRGRFRLPEYLLRAFQNVDLILHAGDVNIPDVLRELEQLAPVHAVFGNNDVDEICATLPATRRIEVEDCVIGITHGDVAAHGERAQPLDFSGNRQTAANALSHFEFDTDVNCVVFGHSHRSLCAWHQTNSNRLLMFNPGSPTDKRFGPHHSFGFLRVDGESIKGELVTW